MSCSNFAFKPFNFQTGRKCLPLLVFKFCPCIGHIWTHFLPFGQRKSGRLKAGKRTERAGCTNVHKAKLRERKAFSRQGRCEYFGTRQAAVFKHTAKIRTAYMPGSEVCSCDCCKVTVGLRKSNSTFDNFYKKVSNNFQKIAYFKKFANYEQKKF